MKTNLTSLMSLIKEKELRFARLRASIIALSTTTTTEELNGTVHTITDNKENYDNTFKEINELCAEITKLRKVLYEKNNTLKLSDGRTIQDAIVETTNLRTLKDTYVILSEAKESTKRVTEVNNSYFEVTKLNYDIKDLKNQIKDLENKINNTEFEISKLNSIEFEIE